LKRLGGFGLRYTGFWPAIYWIQEIHRRIRPGF
jgi:hypothetical protein